jgi:hypothetical protein
MISSKASSKLGLAVEFAYGDPPFCGLVTRDRARLCLRLICGPVFVCDIREREELFRKLQASGVDFFQRLKTEPVRRAHFHRS